MSKLSQKDAVFNAISQVLGSAGISFMGDISVHMTRELRAKVNEILFNSFRAGTIELEREFTDPELRAYVSGLQSNWIRKDKRLNGGVTPAAANKSNVQTNTLTK